LGGYSLGGWGGGGFAFYYGAERRRLGVCVGHGDERVERRLRKVICNCWCGGMGKDNGGRRCVGGISEMIPRWLVVEMADEIESAWCVVQDRAAELGDGFQPCS